MLLQGGVNGRVAGVDNECYGAFGGRVDGGSNRVLGGTAGPSGGLKVAMDGALGNAVPFRGLPHRYTAVGVGDTGDGGG